MKSNRVNEPVKFIFYFFLTSLFNKSQHISNLPLRRLGRDTLVDDPLDLGVLRSPPSEGVASFTGTGSGPDSWITMMSSLLC